MVHFPGNQDELGFTGKSGPCPMRSQHGRALSSSSLCLIPTPLTIITTTHALHLSLPDMTITIVIQTQSLQPLTFCVCVQWAAELPDIDVAQVQHDNLDVRLSAEATYTTTHAVYLCVLVLREYMRSHHFM